MSTLSRRSLDLPRITLFLDYDGVLMPDLVFHTKTGIVLEAPGHALFERAPRLEAVLSNVADLDIVLSTSWVRVLNFDQARRQLSEALRNRVVDATWHPELGDWWWVSLTRFEQILDYVVRNGIQRWIAIDDDMEGWPDEERHHLVLTRSAEGLTEENLDELVYKLKILSSAAAGS
jgi:hypothetical protein